jgi:hypothetical protein
VGDLVAGITPDADIAMVYSAPSKWLMRKYPPLAGPDGGPDAGAYEGIFEPFHRGAFEARRQVRILHARQLHDPRGERPGMAPESAAELHPMLIAPALYVADDGMLDWLGAYAEAGGHLVLGPRTGYGDHPHFGRWPAVTIRRHGAGRVTCVGTVPGRDLARALAVWLAPTPCSGWQGLPDSVTVATGTAPDGRRVHVVHNWSASPSGTSRRACRRARPAPAWAPHERRGPRRQRISRWSWSG